MNVKAKGYILGAIAAATYGMNPLFTLPLYQEGMDPDSVLFFRYLFAIPIMAIMIKSRRRSFKIKKNEILPLVIMGILMALSSLMLFLSYHYMEAGIASTILFVYPIMVALIMCFGFKEKIKPITVACIFMALSGIALLYKGENGESINTYGILCVMLSALSYAMYIVGANRPILKDIATVKLTFYVLVFGLFLFIYRVGFFQNVQVPDADQWYLWGNLLALAALPTALSFLCTTQAIQYIGSTPTAILGALEPITALFFGVIIFDESLTFRMICGVILILVAVTLIIAGNNISPFLMRFRKLFPKIPLRLPKRKQNQ